MTPTQRKAIEGILAYFTSGNAFPVDKATIRGGSQEVQELRAALEQPAVEPFGHVTVSRLSQRFEKHADQYTFYPAWQAPYLDNVDECVPVFTAPQLPADVPMLTNAEIGKALGFSEHTVESSRETLRHVARTIERIVRQKAGLK